MRSSEVVRMLYIILGFLSLALGFIGIFLPLLPTTPFVLLAAYFFSKGSEKLHRWLISQPHFGPMIENWNKYGVIPKRAKIMATTLILISFGYSLLFVRVPLYVKVLIACLGIAVLTFILTRPSEIRDTRS